MSIYRLDYSGYDIYFHLIMDQHTKNIEVLLRACRDGKPIKFLPILLRSSIKTNMPNKIIFYIYLKNMLRCAHKSKKGELKLRIKPINFEGGEELCYSFYDNFHRGPRLSIIIKEENNLIKLTTLPF